MKKMTCNKYTKSCGDLDRQVWEIIIAGHCVIRTVHCSFLVCVSQCICLCSVAHDDMGEKFFHLFVPIAYFCLFVPYSGEMSVCLLFRNCNNMEQNLSREANSFSASQETPCIVCNPKVCYHIHKSLSPVTIVSLIDPTHAPHPTS
jgi:hypothetical protein